MEQSKTQKTPQSYDAFISYSHSEPDMSVAKKLHAMLEHYHVPKKIQKISGKRKIDRVFRDREELALSADLTENIRDALEHSEYLIVICSPKAVKSVWVQREIETFLLNHKRDKVLTILADGEPEAAFPDILCHKEREIVLEDGSRQVVNTRIEPMAADVRGKNDKEREKKLKEEFLRILAPMLSCSYDTLRQRHRDYRFHQILMATGSVAVLAVLFTVYAFHQKAQTEEQYQEARRNQARYLAGISEELLEGGDRMGALKTVMAIVPEDEDSEEAVVPEQMYALNQALYTYQHVNQLSFKAANSYELEGQMEQMSGESSQYLSPDESGCFCMDQTGTAYILDTRTGECLWKITPEDLPAYDDGKFLYFAPVSDTRALLVSEHELICLNWKEKQVEQVIRDTTGFGTGSLTCALEGSRIALANDSQIWVYDLDSGTCIQQAEGQIAFRDLQSMTFSQDGESLLLGGSADGGTRYSEEGGIELLSLENGSIRRISDEETALLCCVDQNRAAAIHYRYTSDEERMSDSPSLEYTIALYDLENGETLWSSQTFAIQAISRPCTLSEQEMEIVGQEQKVLCVSLKDKFLLMDSQTGEILQQKLYYGDIVGVSRYDKSRLLVGLGSGKIYLASLKGEYLNYSPGSISAEVQAMFFSPKQNVLIQMPEDERRIVFSRQILDETMEKITAEQAVRTVSYLKAGQGEKALTYRCIFYGTDQDSGFGIYKANSDKKLYAYSCQESGAYVKDVQIQEIEGKTCVLFQVLGSAGRKVVAAELSSGEQLFEQTVDADKDWGSLTLSSFHQENKVLLYQGSDFALADVSAKGIAIPKRSATLKAATQIWEVKISADDHYVVFGGDEKIQVWDVANSTWKKLEGKEEYAISDSHFALGQESDVLAVYTDKGCVDILDLEKGSCTQSLASAYYDTARLCFMNKDLYLISCGDNRYLSLWDVKEGKLRMKSDQEGGLYGKLCADSDAHYFAILKEGYSASDEEFEGSRLKIYYVDDEGHFYSFADIPYAYVSFDAGEIMVTSYGGNDAYYSPICGYKELKKRAEKLLAGEMLSEEEKRQYFITE